MVGLMEGEIKYYCVKRTISRNGERTLYVINGSEG